MLKVNDIKFSYDKEIEVLRGIDLTLERGEIVSLLGPSGCGKSTLLHLALGALSPTGGSISLSDEVLSDENINTSIKDRNIGIIFQDNALFPNLNVRQNIAYGLKPNSCSSEVDHLLEVFELSDHASKMPHELSGGQQKRVAIARSLAPRPKLILMDESFSGLDPILKHHLRHDISKYLKESNISCLLVTHDKDEAMDFSDRIIILNDGQIVQDGNPVEIYERPNSRFVADFFGSGNYIIEDTELSYFSHKDVYPDSDGEVCEIRDRHFMNGIFSYDVYIPTLNKVFNGIHIEEILKIGDNIGIKYISNHRINA